MHMFSKCIQNIQGRQWLVVTRLCIRFKVKSHLIKQFQTGIIGNAGHVSQVVLRVVFCLPGCQSCAPLWLHPPQSLHRSEAGCAEQP